MIEGRRAALTGHRPLPDTHAGLWLDKFVAGQLREGESPGKNGSPKQAVLEEASQITEPEVYRRFFAAWQTSLGAFQALTRVAAVSGRLITGSGDASVLETAIRLHHTFGVPFIPGTGLKGLAAEYARSHLGPSWGKDGPAYAIVFGSTEDAGYVTFFDALYVPDSAPDRRPLRPDVLTVHHRDYYQNDPPGPPADWDSPTPVPFLSAVGDYLIALAGPHQWAEAALQIVSMAVQNQGMGAKTAAGYGRMTVMTDGAADTPVATARRELAATGTRLKCTVKLVTPAEVVLTLPDSCDDVLGLLPQSEIGASVLRPGFTVKVEVAGVQVRDGRTVVLLKKVNK